MTLEEFKKIADELGSKAAWFHFEVGQLLICLGCEHLAVMLTDSALGPDT
jgi:hypothetical protein